VTRNATSQKNNTCSSVALWAIPEGRTVRIKMLCRETFVKDDSWVLAQPRPVLLHEKSDRLMDKATIELLARRAGLDKALAEFSDDVAAAAEQASGAAARMKAPTDPRAEPWPPMRPGAGR